MRNSPYQIYQQSSVQTATRGQLVIMLYEGAIRFTNAGIEGIHKRDYEKANNNLKKAQAIIHELIASLNKEFEISIELDRIYEYWLHQLIQSNLKKNAVPAIEVLGHLHELRDAWKIAVKGVPSNVEVETGSV